MTAAGADAEGGQKDLPFRKAVRRLALWQGIGAFLWGASWYAILPDGLAGYQLLTEQGGIMERIVKSGRPPDGPYLGLAIVPILLFVAAVAALVGGTSALKEAASEAKTGRGRRQVAVRAAAGYGLALAVIAIHIGYMQVYKARQEVTRAWDSAWSSKRELELRLQETKEKAASTQAKSDKVSGQKR